MRRIPILPTIIVLAVMALTVSLGFWQLERLQEKHTLLRHYTANLSRPPVALPALWPPQDTDLFRRTSAECLEVVSWRAEAGRTAAGVTGWRHLASCRTGVEGPGFVADMGESQSSVSPKWAGGPVRGRLIWAPTGQPLIARLYSPPVSQTPMIVAETPAPGLAATAQPDPSAIPNNHLAYAVQWFLFAAIAGIVYAVALWRRRPVAPPLPRG